MFKIVEARDAVEVIKNGDCIGINAFLALCNPEALHQALFERVKETGQPRDLRLFCAAGFGAWDESRFADPYIAAGAVREAGDDDKHLEAAGKVNVGREKALEAAEAVGGKAVFPCFAEGEREGNPKGFTDFNDMAIKSQFGKEGVKELLGAEIEFQLERQKENRQQSTEQEKNREDKELTRV